MVTERPEFVEFMFYIFTPTPQVNLHLEAWSHLPGREGCRARLRRVYFRSSLAHWSAWEAISIKRIWAICWGIATHHIYRISFFTVWLWQCFFSSTSVWWSSSSSFPRLDRWEIFTLSLFFQPLWASLREASFIFHQRSSEQPHINQTLFLKNPGSKRRIIAVRLPTFEPSWHPELAFCMFAGDIWPFSDKLKFMRPVQLHCVVFYGLGARCEKLTATQQSL